MIWRAAIARRAPDIPHDVCPLLLIGAAAGAVLGVPTALAMLADGKAPVAIAEIADPPIVEADDGGAIARAADGLFYATIGIDGAERRCLVDSGASGLVIGAREARRWAPDTRLRFTGRLVTAGGSRPAARIRLASVTIAGRTLRDVPAIVVAGSDAPCLLGQELLARFDAVELRGDRLTLR